MKNRLISSRLYDCSHNFARLNARTSSPKLPRDLPVVPEWIEYPTETPTMIVRNRDHLGSAGSDGLIANSVRILHHHQHAHRASAKRLRTEVQMLRRLV